jgi:hypothetical protein
MYPSNALTSYIIASLNLLLYGQDVQQPVIMYMDLVSDDGDAITFNLWHRFLGFANRNPRIVTRNAVLQSQR